MMHMADSDRVPHVTDEYNSPCLICRLCVTECVINGCRCLKTLT